MKKRIYMAAVIAAFMIGASGCGFQNKNENLSAGMEAVAALEYDNALASFEAARAAGEDERLILRGEGLAYMGKTMYAEADKLLAKLNLRFKSDKLVGDLSIGDQQMVEIAKVLSFESKVIIMDEPTDALTDTEPNPCSASSAN